MKIGIITDALDEDKGAGIKTYTKNILRHMPTDDITLIHYKECQEKEYAQFKDIIIPMKKLPFYREFRKMWLMPKILENEQFELIHEPCQIGPFFFKSSFKKVVTVHDLSVLLFPETHKAIHYFHHTFGLKRTLKNVDRIIAVSNSTKNDLIRILNIPPHKIEVIYEAASNNYRVIRDNSSLEEFRNRYKLNFRYILYVGTLEPRKNVSGLVKAFYMLKKRGFSHKLVIVGKKGWKYKQLFELIRTLKLSKDIVFTGYVEESDLPYFYNCAELFVYPSRYEGFGLTVIEAMRCGCPVITSNVSSLPEAAGKAAILIDPSDTAQIANAAENVLNNKKLRNEMVKKGIKHSAKFSWEMSSKQTFRLYKTILS